MYALVLCEVKVCAIPHGHVDFKRQSSAPNAYARLLQHFCSDSFYAHFRSPVRVRLWQTIYFFKCDVNVLVVELYIFIYLCPVLE